MPPKTTWSNPQLEILSGDNWEPVGVATSDILHTDDDSVNSRLLGLTPPIMSVRFTLELSAEAQRELNRIIEAYWERRRRLPAIRIRTGVAPKRGRSRRKQRLNRLQRRAKRQSK